MDSYTAKALALVSMASNSNTFANILVSVSVFFSFRTLFCMYNMYLSVCVILFIVVIILYFSTNINFIDVSNDFFVVVCNHALHALNTVFFFVHHTNPTLTSKHHSNISSKSISYSYESEEKKPDQQGQQRAEYFQSDYLTTIKHADLTNNNVADEREKKKKNARQLTESKQTAVDLVAYTHGVRVFLLMVCMCFELLGTIYVSVYNS